MDGQGAERENEKEVSMKEMYQEKSCRVDTDEYRKTACQEVQELQLRKKETPGDEESLT